MYMFATASSAYFVILLVLYFSRHTAFVLASSANPIMYAKITVNPICGDHPSRVWGTPMPYCNISDAWVVGIAKAT
jgi:hypothetical protein